MTFTRTTSSEADQLAATISNLKSRLNQLESSTAYVGSQTNNGRNLIINGAMTVAQRATSATGITTSNYYTADRWQTQITTLGTWTQSVENDGPAETGLRKSLKMLCTTAKASPASTDICLIAQNLEGQDLQMLLKGTPSNRPVALTFWVKSNVTGNYTVLLYDNDNNRSVSAGYTIVSSGVWQFVTIILPGDIVGVLDNDNLLSFSLRFVLAAGSGFTSGTMNTTWQQYAAANSAPGQTNLGSATNNYWQITGVQFECGASSTKFDFEPYTMTLRRCLRYYYRKSHTSSASADYPAVGAITATTSAIFYMPFPVIMRTPPTALETTGTASNYSIMAATQGSGTVVPTFTNASIFSGSFTVTSTGLVAGQGALLITSSSTKGYLGWSAEL